MSFCRRRRPALTHVHQWVSDVMRDTDAFFTPVPTTRIHLDPAIASPSRRRSRHVDVPERVRDASRQEQHGLRALLPRKPAAKDEGRLEAPPRGRGPGAMELGRRRAHRVVQAPGEARHCLVAHQPALSRSAHAAGTDAGRLHRFVEHRPDHPSLPAGGDGCPAGIVVAARPGLRPAGAARHEPRIVSRDAYRRARTAGPRPGLEPRLAAFRRRGLAWAVDRARPPRAGRTRRSRGAPRTVAPDQPVVVPRSHRGQAHAAGLREVRSHLPGGSVTEAITEWKRRVPDARIAVLPCGHYSTGAAPFKFIDGYYLGNFLARNL